MDSKAPYSIEIPKKKLKKKKKSQVKIVLTNASDENLEIPKLTGGNKLLNFIKAKPLFLTLL